MKNKNKRETETGNKSIKLNQTPNAEENQNLHTILYLLIASALFERNVGPLNQNNREKNAEHIRSCPLSP
jgi:hypothetical protein